MFTKFTSLFVAGAIVMAAGNVNAADYFGPSWGSGPSYVSSNVRNFNSGYSNAYRGNGIAVGGCYGKDCTSGSCGTRPYDGTWSRDRWDNNRWDNRSVNTLPYRSPSYLPVYRPSTYNSAFNHNLPGYGHSTWNSGHGSYR